MVNDSGGEAPNLPLLLPLLLQTGSGKTFSMSGLEERLAAHRGFRTVDASAGIIPRAVRYL